MRTSSSSPPAAPLPLPGPSPRPPAPDAGTGRVPLCDTGRRRRAPSSSARANLARGYTGGGLMAERDSRVTPARRGDPRSTAGPGQGRPAGAPGAKGSLEERVRGLVAQGDLRRAAGLAIGGLSPAVRRYLGATLRDAADADDAFSHWEENLWHGLATFRFECSLRTWALRLATNAAINARNEPWNRRVRRF